MKKLLSLITITISIMAFATTTIAATKYDPIIKDAGWKQVMTKVDEFILSNRVLKDYFVLLVNKNDLTKLSKSGELDKEKSKFLLNNTNEFLKYLYFLIATMHVNSIKPEQTDAQFIYITGVIKDPHAQAATTGPEYQMEKMMLREMPLYKLWEIWREEGFLSKIVNEQIDLMYKAIQKQK